MQITEIPEFDDTIVIDDSTMNDNQTDHKDQDRDDDIINDTDDQLVDDNIIIDDTSDDKNNDGSNNDVSNYGENADPVAVATFEQLLEHGVLPEEFKKDFDGSWEKIEEGLKDLPQRVLNTIVAEAPDIAKAVVRFAFSSPNITREELIEFNKTFLEETTPIDINIETMDDARDFLQKLYSERGAKPRVIEATLAALEDDDILMEEAKEELEKQKESKKGTPKTEQLIANKENEEIRRIEAQNAFTLKLQEELNTIGWKPTKVNEVKQRFSELNTLLSEVYKNPKSLIKLTDFLGYYKDGDFDYTKFINSLETPIAKDMKSRLQDVVNSPTLSTKSNFKNQTSQSDKDKPII